MNENLIITIGRQFGSGGREIGRCLADSLGIPYYDKELLALAAKESGLCAEVFERADERTSDGMAHAFAIGAPFIGFYTPRVDVLSNDSLFKLQSDAIRKLAQQESCVIVGRCADYILRDYPGCVSFFIHDNMENRVRRIIERSSVSEEQAVELISKTDKSRAAYYDYYTNKTWGMASSYDVCIDASTLGLDNTIEFIKDFIRLRAKA
jgi:cytidylate kinase